MIKDFIQSYSEAISSILEVEVTIVDENFRRVSGTGIYKEGIGEEVPHGSFFKSIVQNGEPGIIANVKDEFACDKCNKRDECKELANIGFPIYKGDRVVGVIGLIAFDVEQREKLISSMDKLKTFLMYMSKMLESKLLLMEVNTQLRQKIDEVIDKNNIENSFSNIIGIDPKFLNVIDKAKKISKTSSTVMIRGESGTGKDLLAKAIHGASSRKDNLFVAVNCASIPESLMESELFGYEEGTFTGARKGGKMGKFELANESTIFLDEIGDMPLSMQSKLLRVLQERCVDRIGGKEPIPIDVRVISATNKNLETLVKEGKFREDLYYRLNVIPLCLPPLRERKDDIILLFNHFMTINCKKTRRNIPIIHPSLKRWLKNYSWPGNVRQLKNIAEYMTVMASDDMMTIEDIPEYLVEKDVKIDKNLSLQEMLDEYEKNILKAFIKENMTTEEKLRVAEELSISKATLYRKLNKYGLS